MPTNESPDLPETQECFWCGHVGEDVRTHFGSDTLACSVCAGHLRECELCGQWGTDVAVWDLMTVRRQRPVWLGGRAAHEDCLWDSEYQTCVDCGRLFEPGTRMYGDGYCPQCWGIEPGYDDENIYNYGYKPEPVFIHADGLRSEVPRENIYFGVELEVEVDGSVYDASCDISGTQPMLYLKRDATIEYGFEIVSHPGTLEAWKAGKVIDWEEWVGTLRHIPDQHLHSNVGMHVHVSRTAFLNGKGKPSFSHQWRFQQLHMRNPKTFQRIAGRRGSDYASWNPEADRAIMYDTVKSNFGGRSRPINPNNRFTLEMRYFQSEEEKGVILGKIELLHAAIEYTRHMTAQEVKDGALDFLNFYSWVREQGDIYDELVFLVETRHAVSMSATDRAEEPARKEMVKIQLRNEREKKRRILVWRRRWNPHNEYPDYPMQPRILRPHQVEDYIRDYDSAVIYYASDYVDDLPGMVTALISHYVSAVLAGMASDAYTLFSDRLSATLGEEGESPRYWRECQEVAEELNGAAIDRYFRRTRSPEAVYAAAWKVYQVLVDLYDIDLSPAEEHTVLNHFDYRMWRTVV